MRFTILPAIALFSVLPSALAGDGTNNASISAASTSRIEVPSARTDKELQIWSWNTDGQEGTPPEIRSVDIGRFQAQSTSNKQLADHDQLANGNGTFPITPNPAFSIATARENTDQLGADDDRGVITGSLPFQTHPGLVANKAGGKKNFQNSPGIDALSPVDAKNALAYISENGVFHPQP